MSDELMNDKEAANTIMFLFFNLDDYDRDYFFDDEDFLFTFPANVTILYLIVKTLF